MDWIWTRYGAIAIGIIQAFAATKWLEGLTSATDIAAVEEFFFVEVIYLYFIMEEFLV